MDKRTGTSFHLDNTLTQVKYNVNTFFQKTSKKFLVPFITYGKDISAVLPGISDHIEQMKVMR